MKTKIQINNNCLQSIPCVHDVIIGNDKSVSMTQIEIKKYLKNKDLYDCVYITDIKIMMDMDKKLIIEKLEVPQEFKISDNDHLWQ